MEDGPGDAVELGPRDLEGSLASGYKVNLLRSTGFYKKVAWGKFS